MSDPKRLPAYSGSILDLMGRRTPRKRGPIEVLRYIVDFHPESSQAVWNYVRMIVPDVTLKVTTENGEDDEAATNLLKGRMSVEGIYGRDYGGGLLNIMRVLVLTLLTQGAVVGELELSESLDDVLDWCPVSPYMIRFVKDKETGHFHAGVDWRGQVYLLPEDQCRYFPLDPNIGDPHGRAPFWAAFEIVFTHAEVLRDLKAVVHFAGWPRLGVKVLQEVVEMNMPDHLNEPGNEVERKAWLDGYLSDIQTLYNELEVDDALIHYDWIETDSLDAGRATVDIEHLMNAIERSLTSALKHLPQLLGRIQGSTATHSTVQWQIFAQTITALRGAVKAVAEWWANSTLQILGIPSKATLTFPTLRTQDREREAKARHQEWRTDLEMFYAGLLSQEELAQTYASHPPVGDVDYGALLKIPMLVVGSGEGTGAEEGVARMIQRVVPGAPRASGGHLLPAWMRYHQRRWTEAVGAFADARRFQVFDVLMEENGGNSSG